MTRWARLTWQAADPAALAAELERGLGVRATAHPSVDGGLLMPLGSGELELVPWHRETADDAPQRGGRLVFEPIEDGATPLEPAPGVPPLSLVGVAWASVELDRAESELGAWLTPPDATGATGGQVDGTEPHLGARTRVRGAPGLPGDMLVLCEPATEGRLAASLARDGEGPCALYLRPAGSLSAWRAAARARGAVVSTPHRGPLGRSVILPGATVAGPHIIVTEADDPSSGGGPAGTIEP